MTTSNKNLLADRIMEAFEARNLRTVADKLGENYSSFYNWAVRRREIPNEILIKIAQLTSISLNWLLTGEGEKYAAPGSQITLDETFERFVRKIVREELASNREKEN